MASRSACVFGIKTSTLWPYLGGSKGGAAKCYFIRKLFYPFFFLEKTILIEM